MLAARRLRRGHLRQRAALRAVLRRRSQRSAARPRARSHLRPPPGAELPQHRHRRDPLRQLRRQARRRVPHPALPRHALDLRRRLLRRASASTASPTRQDFTTRRAATRASPPGRSTSPSTPACASTRRPAASSSGSRTSSASSRCAASRRGRRGHEAARVLVARCRPGAGLPGARSRRVRQQPVQPAAARAPRGAPAAAGELRLGRRPPARELLVPRRARGPGAHEEALERPADGHRDARLRLPRRARTRPSRSRRASAAWSTTSGTRCTACTSASRSASATRPRCSTACSASAPRRAICASCGAACLTAGPAVLPRRRRRREPRLAGDGRADAPMDVAADREHGIGPADALFGSFVQLFVRQIATSDKTLDVPDAEQGARQLGRHAVTHLQPPPARVMLKSQCSHGRLGRVQLAVVAAACLAAAAACGLDLQGLEQATNDCGAQRRRERRSRPTPPSSSGRGGRDDAPDSARSRWGRRSGRRRCGRPGRCPRGCAERDRCGERTRAIAAGAENCTNGIDDDCNGLVDCADPAVPAQRLRVHARRSGGLVPGRVRRERAAIVSGRLGKLGSARRGARRRHCVPCTCGGLTRESRACRERCRCPSARTRAAAPACRTCRSCPTGSAIPSTCDRTSRAAPGATAWWPRSPRGGRLPETLDAPAGHVRRAGRERAFP